MLEIAHATIRIAQAAAVADHVRPPPLRGRRRAAGPHFGGLTVTVAVSVSAPQVTRTLYVPTAGGVTAVRLAGLATKPPGR